MKLPRTLLVGLAVLALLGGLATTATAASTKSARKARTSWAPASSAAVHPGVQTYTDGAQCTANFVFQDSQHVYLGQSAHCSGLGQATDTDGCETDSLPLGTPVKIDGASKPGRLAYSSWITMRARGEKNRDACAYNDFALVRIDPADLGKVNPSLPYWGGPSKVGGPTARGDVVYTYGNSSLRLGLSLLSPKTGESLRMIGGYWAHEVQTANPGVPGDSGSGFVDENGAAIGALSTVAAGLPYVVWNTVTDLSKALAYAQAYGDGMSGVQLVSGTQEFQPGLGLAGL